MLNCWFSSNDDFCADYFFFSRFMLKGKGRSLMWEVFLYDGMSILWTVIVRKCCPGVCSRCRCATTVPGMVQTVQNAV